MKLEDQVHNLELARKLKELGVKQESYFYWLRPAWADSDEKAALYHFDEWQDSQMKNVNQTWSAFTVAELGEMLGCYIGEVQYFSSSPTPWQAEEYDGIREHTEANARAKMLVYLIEKGVVKP